MSPSVTPSPLCLLSPQKPEFGPFTRAETEGSKVEGLTPTTVGRFLLGAWKSERTEFRGWTESPGAGGGPPLAGGQVYGGSRRSPSCKRSGRRVGGRGGCDLVSVDPRASGVLSCVSVSSGPALRLVLFLIRYGRFGVQGKLLCVSTSRSVVGTGHYRGDPCHSRDPDFRQVFVSRRQVTLSKWSSGLRGLSQFHRSD